VIDPKLDLVLERNVDVPPELVWRAWTQPEHLVKWFTPAPWTTVKCEIDLRPGGIFHTVMRSPEGQDFPHHGCYLEIIPNQRLIWTDALGPAFRPSRQNPRLSFHFTAAILLEPHGTGTQYRAIVMHGDEESRAKHERMGFHDGWGKALDQLVEHMKILMPS
jgi:uncharacterized protein YndB with AHSA1/START domain